MVQRQAVPYECKGMEPHSTHTVQEESHFLAAVGVAMQTCRRCQFAILYPLCTPLPLRTTVPHPHHQTPILLCMNTKFTDNECNNTSKSEFPSADAVSDSEKEFPHSGQAGQNRLHQAIERTSANQEKILPQSASTCACTARRDAPGGCYWAWNDKGYDRKFQITAMRSRCLPCAFSGPWKAAFVCLSTLEKRMTGGTTNSECSVKQSRFTKL